MCCIPKMRGINECYAWLKAQDPETQITKWRFRNLVNEGIIPSSRNGRCILINQDMLPEYLKKWAESMEQEAENIREQTKAESRERELSKVATAQSKQCSKYGQIRAI